MTDEEKQHTPGGQGYAERAEWMEQMHENGWRQVKHPEHDRYCLWVLAAGKHERVPDMGAASSKRRAEGRTDD